MPAKTNNSLAAKLSLIISMVIFGTIGIFRMYIPLPSGMLAMLRGLIGATFLLIIITFSRQGFNIKAIKNNILLLSISGALIGFNWILLFEAYNYTSVATATLCYYMAPVFVIFASPIFLKEKLTLKQVACSFIALLGMCFVSGIFDAGFSNLNEFVGVALGLSAAMLYASVIILNKKLTDVGSYDRTIIQLASAGIVLVPYSLLVENVSAVDWNINVLFLILLLGLVHTGIAYTLYFGSIKGLKAQTTAFYSYIDPIVAIILSAIILGDNMTFYEILGALLILGATFTSEIHIKKKS